MNKEIEGGLYHSVENISSHSNRVSSPLSFDAAKYRDDIKDFDLSEADATAFLEALWSIMCSMVELGISVDVCGQLVGSVDPVLTNDAGSIDSHHQSS